MVVLGVIIKSFSSVISSLFFFKGRKQTAVYCVYNSLGGFVLSCTITVVVVVCFCFSSPGLATILHYTQASYYLVDAVITPTWKPFFSFLSFFYI